MNELIPVPQALDPAALDRLSTRPGGIDPATVIGWGVDADPLNDPTYPYRDRSQDDGLTSNWQRPALQPQGVELLQSIEHIRRPAVFGTSTPPSGVSGVIRRIAFRWSESNWLHWLLLIGADRINVVEGVVQDLARAKIPNIPAEMGIKAEWRHNKAGLTKKVTVLAGLSAAVYLGAHLLSRRNGERQSPDGGSVGLKRDRP